jgi:aryl-phospho-beta-D-glucosidase BglC (GH1 family)
LSKEFLKAQWSKKVMLSLLNITLTWRQTLLPLPLLLSLVASILIGGAAPTAHAAESPACAKHDAQHPSCAQEPEEKQQGDPVSWTTSGTQIIAPNGSPFTITGINWYGFETTSYVAHGLYSQNYTTIVDEIKQYGYNTIRIPFSNQMWETNPIPKPNTISACSICKSQKLHSRDILALIINYAGSIGLHVILDNHRSEAGNSAEANGLWYNTSRRQPYTEASWITDWANIQRWVNENILPTVPDGSPVVLGYDLRNEPHTPPRTAYLQGATWGTGDGISPATNPNPNPFAPACVASSTCHDWRLAAERAADTLLGDADQNGWPRPLIFVEGISQYPQSGGTATNGPYDFTWWGGDLQGVDGNSTNPGAPIVLNAGRNPDGSLGAAVSNQLVYSAHDYGPSVFGQGWFTTGHTCYRSGCFPPTSTGTLSSLADVWNKFWAYINVPNGVNPAFPSDMSSYPWSNTGTTPYTQAPMWIGEFGTGNASSDLFSTGPGSEGQWFTDLVNFIQSSYTRTTTNDSGIAVTNLQWTYWALNTEDSFALLASGYMGLANPTKEYTFLCSIQQPPFVIQPTAMGGLCGSTGELPQPS